MDQLDLKSLVLEDVSLVIRLAFSIQNDLYKNLLAIMHMSLTPGCDMLIGIFQDFFQKALPFLIELQNILRKYPDGGQILKELIQNADDAKASEVIFVYDERQYGTETLCSDSLHNIQGPAILVYNNEVFSEDDWQGIQKPGNSIKRKDPNTVGKFGLGFNSVYHITDFPSIFSGRNIGILDPQELVFHRGGCLWNLQKNRRSVEELSDQFHPFHAVLEAIGCGSWGEILNAGYFKGTLFRFPLRLAPSEISEDIYSSAKVQELFESFIHDATISLLFLRYVNTVSLKKIGTDGSMICLLTVTSSTEMTAGTESDEIITGTLLKTTCLNGIGREEERSSWLVTTSSVHGNAFSDLSELSEKLYNKPTLDLAYPLSIQGGDQISGRMSCVLPLPDTDENQTGLPVVINGCFDLTDDRRSMKWLEIDQQHDKAAMWNHILVQKLLPLVYTRAVKDSISLVKMSKITLETAYGIWPDPEKTKHSNRWYGINKQIAQALLGENILQTIDNSRWINASEAIFLKNINDNDLLNCLEKLLIFVKQPLVKVPGHIHRTLKLAENKIGRLNTVTPSFIRGVLRKVNCDSIPEKQKILLLRYVLSDEKYHKLLNLQLLPLSDGTFTSFQDTDSGDTVYVDSQEFPRILLPGLSRRFLPKYLPGDILSQLSKIGSKGIFQNLMHLNATIIKNNLSAALPITWNSCEDQVVWNPGDPSHPPVEWLSAFWALLQHNDLRFFENQPLVPLNVIEVDCTEIQLGRLKRNTTFLFRNRDTHSLTEHMVGMLKQLGCNVIQETNSWLWHKNLSSYILVPTPNNILKAFSHLNLNQLIQAFAAMTEERTKVFSEFFSQAYAFEDSELKILCQLPMFRSIKSLSVSSSRLVPADRLCAVEIHPFITVPENLVLPKTIIKCRDESDKRLLHLLKKPLWKIADVVLLLGKSIQLGQYRGHEQHAQNAVLWILRNGSTIFRQNTELAIFFKNHPFIPCNGKFVKPSDLFDPKVTLFKDLFEPNRFPPAIYEEDAILKTLRHLGLISTLDRITVSDVLQIALEISQGQDRVASLNKSKALIHVCNKTEVLGLLNRKDLIKLCGLSWVPVNSDTSFSELCSIRSNMHVDIVEFSMPLTSYFNEKASLILGLQNLPPPDKVVQNLQTISGKYPKIDLHTLLIKLHKIYNYILQNTEQFSSSLLSELRIWSGDDFCNPTEIVLVYPDGLDLSSMVKKVTTDFLTYRNLFMKCGVRETLTNTEVLSIMYSLDQRINRNTLSGTYKEMRLAISILNWIKVNSIAIKEDLPIPVQDDENRFTMKPLSTTLFCDLDKKHLGDISCTDFNIVHKDISQATAEYLNIQMLSTKILQPEFFEPWGPSEPISQRIKNILREYCESVDVFKELVQNAEDAEATICDFLFDMRQNTKSQQSLIDPGMASCHGAALWSHNNSTFTENDFVNITRVGASTKETQVEKIGKFGLGFNTVYHITDIPWIMSRSNVLIFDPNVSHMRKHIMNAANPGIKLNLQNSKILHTFPDQFHPFSNVFNCELKQPFYYDGTLIRLPFRTEEEARDSQICKKFFNKEQIKCLMNSFGECVDTLLVFLKNVQVVTLSFLREDLCPGDQELRVEIQRHDIQRITVPQNTILQQKQLQIFKHLGIQISSLDIAESKLIKINVQRKTINEQYYLLQSSLGINESVLMSLKQNALIEFLPFAAVALPLKHHHGTGKYAPDLKDFNGMLFCFLPTPISTGLPFHLNGCFSVMSNRKSLWDTTRKGEWNKKLLRDAALVALVIALTQLLKMCQNGNLQEYCYYTFWPNIRNINTQFAELARAFYQAVSSGISNYFPALFSNGCESCTIKHACFLKLDKIKNESICSIAGKVFSFFLKKPYLAITLPEWVEKCFLTSHCHKELQQNIYDLERFYTEIVFENLQYLDTEDRNALIVYAIDMKNEHLNNLLVTKPCIPTSGGQLQSIGKLIHPNGKVSVLYEVEEGFFPEGSAFLNPRRLDCLEDLGMTKDRLPMNSLIERAHKINGVWKKDRNKAIIKICSVLELLRDLHKDFSNSDYQSMFRNITFLPGDLPPINPGQKVDTDLLKPTEMYHYELKDLINMVKPVLRKEHVGKHLIFCDKLTEFLGLNGLPTWNLVLAQLQEAHKIAEFVENHKLSDLAKKCYKYLNLIIERTPSQADKIREQTFHFPFVYTGKKFVPLESVAHIIPFDASPYLYQLPGEYQIFDKLWSCLGIRKHFSFQNCISVIEMMAKKHEGCCLPEKELHLVVQLICHSTEKIPEDTADTKIFVPDNQGVLREINHLYFNDTPWIPSDEDLHFCHDLIPRPIAIKLGIKMKIHHMLNKLSISELSEWGSQFGAKEDLPTRLKNIISEYSMKKDILKELIQNSDDSDATEIHFVLDNRNHKKTSTFGSEWNPLHGPALCIYNNKKFDKKDIEGIQLLGKGGKGKRVDKTGKFGIGFNTVYHITDCPSFVTGDNIMCVFDPNLTFLPTSTVDSPGRIFTVNNKFKETFQDVYDTFLPSLFNLQVGTLFRLPLRMADTVLLSKICNQTVSLENIRDMARDLEDDADNMILFLNNIKRITFSEISISGEVKEMMHIETKINENWKAEKCLFQEMLSQVVESEVSRVPQSQVFYEMEISCSSYSTPQIWLVAKQIGIEGEDNLAALHTIFCNLHQCLIPCGAIAACLNKNPKGRAFCTLPLPIETGLPVHISANFIVDSSRRDICKEDGGSSKTEWNLFLLTNVIAPLYCMLLDRIRQKNTNGTEQQMHKSWTSYCQFLDKYLSFFPYVSDNVSPLWQKMVRQVYQKLSEEQFKPIPVYKTKPDISVVVNWSSVVYSSVTEMPYFTMNDKYKEISVILQNINMKLASGGKFLSLFKEFKDSDVNVIELSPKTLCNFLRHIQIHPHGQLPMPVSKTILKKDENCRLLLKYCLGGCKKDLVQDDLHGVPLLLTEDGMLREFNKKEPCFYTSFPGLFPLQNQRFAKSADYRINLLVDLRLLKYVELQDAAIFIKEFLGPEYKTTKNKIHPEHREWFKILWKYFESELKKKKVNESCINVFEEIQTLFSDWAILPVHYDPSPKEVTLLSLCNLKIILPDCRSDVEKCLYRLGFPELDNQYMSVEMTIYYIQSHCLNTKNCESVINQLYSLQSQLNWKTLQDRDLDTLLIFSVEGLRNNKGFLKQLETLPLFETYTGGRHCLTGYNKKYILTVNQLILSRIFEIDPQVIFLKDNRENRELCKHLNITPLDANGLLDQYILPHLKSFSDSEILEILQYVLVMPDYNKYHPDIVKAFKPLRFIKDIQGTLQESSYFYNPDVKLFSTFGLQSRFIPHELTETFKTKKEKFFQLLKALGMHKKPTEEDIIKFAIMIEKEAAEGKSLDLLSSKSEELFQHILSMNKTKITENFITKLKSIKFIIPLDVDSTLKSLHPSYADKHKLIPIKGSLLKQRCSDDFLVWTSMGLLQTNSSKRICFSEQNSILELFGVFFNPPQQFVVENLKNICNATCDQEHLLAIRCKALKIIYNKLQEVKKFDTKSLADVPFILVHGDALAQPDMVVLHLPYSEKFHPYLFKLPSDLIRYSEFFQNVGVETDATVFHYTKVLSMIYEETLNKHSLHSNLKRTVSEALRQLFKILEEQIPNNLDQIKHLYLPATDGKLYDSSALVLQNVMVSDLSQRFKFCSLDSVKPMDLYEQESLIKLLPNNIRPKLLSQMVEQCIDVDTITFCAYAENCDLQSHFHRLLNSSKFQDGFACLLRSQYNGELTEHDAALRCKVVFEKLEIKCCIKMQTIFKHNGEMLQGTNTDKQVFVAKTKESHCQMYFLHRDNMYETNLVTLCGRLAKEMNNIMQNIFTSGSLFILIEMLSCKHPDEIMNVLKENGIWVMRSPKHHVLSLSSPGEQIPVEWYEYLDMSILNSFSTDDYVGYKDSSEEEIYIYAVIVSELDPKMYMNCEMHKMYCIKLGKEEFADVSILDLYQFKRNVTKKCNALVLVEDAGEENEEKWYDLPTESIKKEIDILLRQIWELSEQERSNAVRRLYLKYHPDKNIGQETIATEICKYLQKRISDLVAGRPFRNPSQDFHGQANSSENFNEYGGEWYKDASNHKKSNFSKGNKPDSPGKQPSSSNDFSEYWEKWDREASNHKKGYFSHRTNFSGKHRKSYYSNPQEAKRWLRQAMCDIKSAEHEVGYHQTEWLFYKVHQAVQKALLAAQYMKEGIGDKSLDIKSLSVKVAAYSFSLENIKNQVMQLEQYGVDKLKTQYPSYHPAPGIPNDCISSDKEEEVMVLAKKLLNKLEAYICQ